MPDESVITQQMREAVGVDSAPATHEVEKGAIIRFARAIGDPNPIYSDEAAARQTRYGGLIAPPTFLRSLESSPPEVDFPNPYPEVLDGGSEWEYFEPVRPGDRITVTARIADLTERTGSLGNMLFVAFESRYVNHLGVLVAHQRGTYIYYQPSDVTEG